MTISEFYVIIIHAFIGWALCAATLGIGMAFTSLDNALILHAIAVPIFFAVVSLVYFRKFNYTSPLQTATIFLAYAIGMDPNRFDLCIYLVDGNADRKIPPVGYCCLNRTKRTGMMKNRALFSPRSEIMSTDCIGKQ